MEPRFALLRDSDLDKLIDGKDSNSTKQVISTAENVYKSYCEVRGFDASKIDNEFTAGELDSFLRTFYAKLSEA